MYDVVYADPPWEYRQSGTTKSARGIAKKYYPTMATSDIASLPVRERLCHDKTLLFLWSTFPNITEAVRVMEAWGFTYKTAAFVWVKRNKRADSYFWGMGAYTRANSEACLLGVSPGTKATEVVVDRGVHQIVYSPVRRHSEKPPEVRWRIERLVGSDVRKVELFAREKAPGWDVWGLEVQDDVAL